MEPLNQESSRNLVNQKGEPIILVGRVHTTIMLFQNNLFIQWHTGWEQRLFAQHSIGQISKPNNNLHSYCNIPHGCTSGYQIDSQDTHL